MIRNVEYNATGELVTVEVLDPAAGTYTREEYGLVVEVRPLTAAEIAAHANSADVAPTVDPAQLAALIDGATSLAKARDAMRAIVAAITP